MRLVQVPRGQPQSARKRFKKVFLDAKLIEEIVKKGRRRKKGSKNGKSRPSIKNNYYNMFFFLRTPTTIIAENGQRFSGISQSVCSKRLCHLKMTLF
jgi:hypothetical protein